MKKCYSLFNPLGRKRGACGIFDGTQRQYFATDEADARNQFAAEVETGGPTTICREWKSPFDADCLFDFVKNTRDLSDQLTYHTGRLRALMDLAARNLAGHNQNWHDDKASDDHPLFQAPAEVQFPRELRDAAILDLVRDRLEIINENERSKAK